MIMHVHRIECYVLIKDKKTDYVTICKKDNSVHQQWIVMNFWNFEM